MNCTFVLSFFFLANVEILMQEVLYVLSLFVMILLEVCSECYAYVGMISNYGTLIKLVESFFLPG